MEPNIIYACIYIYTIYKINEENEGRINYQPLDKYRLIDIAEGLLVDAGNDPETACDNVESLLSSPNLSKSSNVGRPIISRNRFPIAIISYFIFRIKGTIYSAIKLLEKD